jgi:activating signal cointegrator complex subunit 2
MASSAEGSKQAHLPPFRPSLVKQKLPFEQFDSIQHLLCAQIQLFLQNSPSPSTVLAFLQAYLSDAAQECLKLLYAPLVVDSASQNTILLRQQVLALLGHLAENHPISITQVILIGTVIVYGPKNAARVKRFLSDLLGRREPQFKAAIATSLSRMLSEISSSARNSIEGIRRVAHILATVVRTGVPTILESMSGNSTLNDIAITYDRILPPFISTSKLDEVPLSSGAKSWLQTKVDLLDSFHILFDHLLTSETHLKSSITLLSDLTKSVDVTGKSRFVDFPLIADYQHQFDLGKRLQSLNASHDDPSLDVLVVAVANLGPANPDAFGPLSVLLKKPTTDDRASDGTTYDQKGKGKACPTGEGVEEVVTQILEMLPDQDADFLRRCLTHPRFTGSDRQEKLVSALLEENLPAELMMEEISSPAANEPPLPLPSTGKGKENEKKYHYTKDRQNVFDDQPFDISALRIGKKR